MESFVTQEIIDEYKDTVDYLKNKYSSKPLQITLTHIISACRLIESNTVVKVCRDPDDDKFISCAIDAKCVYIVSGDKDLLTVKEYKDIKIITVAEFFDRWK